MSEIDLIRKLEKLNTEKPNKEWSCFTRESILSSKVEIEESHGFGFWFNRIRNSSFAPLTACVFLAVVFGMSIINVTPNNTDTLRTAENENENVGEEGIVNANTLTASIIDNIDSTVESQPIKEIQVVATVDNEENQTIENDDYAIMMNIIGGQEILGEELEKRIQRIEEEIEDLESIEERSIEDQKRYLELRAQLQVFENVFKNKEN